MREKTSFTDRLSFAGPPGFLDAIAAAARREHTTASEFLRRAALDRIAAAGVQLEARSDNGGTQRA
jgi:hypothetical protein